MSDQSLIFKLFSWFNQVFWSLYQFLLLSSPLFCPSLLPFNLNVGLRSSFLARLKSSSWSKGSFDAPKVVSLSLKALPLAVHLLYTPDPKKVTKFLPGERKKRAALDYHNAPVLPPEYHKFCALAWRGVKNPGSSSPRLWFPDFDGAFLPHGRLWFYHLGLRSVFLSMIGSSSLPGAALERIARPNSLLWKTHTAGSTQSSGCDVTVFWLWRTVTHTSESESTTFYSFASLFIC